MAVMRRGGKTLRLEGFQKRLKPDTTSKVSMAVISVKTGVVTCNCGWSFHHPRSKVLEDRAESHVERKHEGSALWM